MILSTNRFLRSSDFEDTGISNLDNTMDELRRQFNYLYKELCNGKPHLFGAKDPNKVTMHWSREWEYPWAIINSDIEKGLKVLDCGCGGSPLVLYLAQVWDCEVHGVDINYGCKLKKNADVEKMKASKKPLLNLRHFYVEPDKIVRNGEVRVRKGDMSDLGFYEDDIFDRVYCISTIEHLEKDVAQRSIAEMVRVLRPGGSLVITMDHNGIKPRQVLKWCEGQYQQIIDWSGLQLCGTSDFTVPSLEEIDGLYHVVGFTLRKG